MSDSGGYVTNFVITMFFSVSQYLLSVENFRYMSRTLSDRKIYPLRDEATGALKCRVGNSVIVFEVMCDGVHSALRVYVRPHRNLRAIYGENYYPQELLVSSTDVASSLADVVLCEWHEGKTLQSAIEKMWRNQTKMKGLSALFEKFAISLLNEPWAHGDLKPENIIFTKDGFRLIDFDALYRPGFSPDDCVEIGTRQYQHPKRDISIFDKTIDDYPVALITTVLAALSLNSNLGRRLPESDYLLIQPHLAVAGEDKMLERIERLFAEAGDARHYRIARLLRSTTTALPQLKTLLESAPSENDSDESLSLEYCNGAWGYMRGGEFVIPPLYDLAFEFSEGLGLVRVADVWHFIDERGRVVITCGRGEGVKPFRCGKTEMKREDGEVVIYRDGRIEAKNRV